MQLFVYCHMNSLQEGSLFSGRFLRKMEIFKEWIFSVLQCLLWLNWYLARELSSSSSGEDCWRLTFLQMDNFASLSCNPSLIGRRHNPEAITVDYIVTTWEGSQNRWKRRLDVIALQLGWRRRDFITWDGSYRFLGIETVNSLNWPVASSRIFHCDVSLLDAWVYLLAYSHETSTFSPKVSCFRDVASDNFLRSDLQ